MCPIKTPEKLPGCLDWALGDINLIGMPLMFRRQ